MGEGYSLDVVSIRLVKDAPIMSDYRLAGAEDVTALMGSVLGDLDKEVVCVINLKADGTPINCNFASMGTVSRSLACPKELFKSSILSNAAMMMLAHNHPSGNLTPSKEDINLTGHMIVLCDMMGIPLVDHVIVGGDSGQYFSFLNNGLMPDVHKKFSTCAVWLTANSYLKYKCCRTLINLSDTCHDRYLLCTFLFISRKLESEPFFPEPCICLAIQVDCPDM